MRRATVVGVALAFLGCGVTPEAPDAGPSSEPDAAVVVDADPPDAGPPDAGPPEPVEVDCAARAAGEVGNGVGDTLPSFFVTDCDGETVRYPEDFACPAVTVILATAGWCAPCVDETVHLMEELVEPYRERGLEVVQVLYENDAVQPATADYCAAWTESFGLRDMRVVLDRASRVRPFWGTPMGYPDAIVLDANGVVRFRGDLTTEVLAEAVERLLTEVGR